MTAACSGSGDQYCRCRGCKPPLHPIDAARDARDVRAQVVIGVLMVATVIGTVAGLANSQ